MEIKVSYVQARRFIDFHTLILNHYNLDNFSIAPEGMKRV